MKKSILIATCPIFRRPRRWKMRETRRWFITGIMFAAIMQTGCSCRYFGAPEVLSVASILEYKQGAELPEYFLTTKNNLRLRWDKPMLTKTDPLTAGFYITPSSYDNYEDMVIMDFTLEDYYAGNIPEGWIDHWEEHVLVEKPFRAVWVLSFHSCEENYGVPYYCEACASTYRIDTSCINRLIEGGEVWDYAYRIYLDTTAIAKE